MKDFVIVTYANGDALDALSAQYGALISGYRRKKTERLSDKAERERGLLAEYCLLAALQKSDPLLKLPPTIQTERFGKPYLAESPLYISLSHAGEYGCAAVSDRPVGVDIEGTRTISDKLARRILTDAEWETLWLPHPSDETFRDLFSAKESLIKRGGEGLQGIRGADLTKTNAVRQYRLGAYVLSVACDVNGTWEGYECEKDGSFSLRFCF